MQAPGPENKPIKNFLQYRKAPISFFQGVVDSYGPIAEINFFGKRVLLVSGPKEVEHVLGKAASRYQKGRTTQKLKAVMGKGLITNDGQEWRKQNQLIRKSFSVKKIQALVPLFQRHADEMTARINDKSEIDIVDELHHTGLNIMMDSLFQVKEGKSTYPELSEDIKFFLDFTVTLTRSLNPLKMLLPTKEKREFKRRLQRMDDYIHQIINERKEKVARGEEFDDLLSLLITAESIEDFNLNQTRDEVVTLLMAGHETISNALSFAMILIAKNPSWQERLLEDPEQAKNVFMESMRLYPPVWVFMREAIEEDTIGEVKVARGTQVIVCPYYTHRSSVYWEDALIFNPDRFKESPRPNQGIDGVRYYPFGHGPRICLGNHMAEVEASTILMTLVKSFEWSLTSPEAQEVNAGITLSPKNNRQIQLKKREG